jgi:peptide/nickel transport system permease protein
MRIANRRLIGYAVRRLAFALVLVLLVSSAALVLVDLAPGDVTAELFAEGASQATIARERHRLGLDRPLAEQYVSWLGRAVRFDLGTSLRYQRPVRDLLGERIGNTALLGACALVLATLVGLPLGVVTGSRGGWLPRAVRMASMTALSVPPLVSSLLLALLAARTGWFPVGGTGLAGAGPGVLATAGTLAWHLALPTLALALPFAATIERLQSEAMTAALAEPHIQAARARGVAEARLVWRHALRPSLRSVAAIYGIIIGTLFSGSFAVEIVTAWPGLGRLMYDALVSRDIYLVAGCAAAGSLFLAAGTLASDVALAALDPRLRQDEP